MILFPYDELKILRILWFIENDYRSYAPLFSCFENNEADLNPGFKNMPRTLALSIVPQQRFKRTVWFLGLR